MIKMTTAMTGNMYIGVEIVALEGELLLPLATIKGDCEGVAEDVLRGSSGCWTGSTDITAEDGSTVGLLLVVLEGDMDGWNDGSREGRDEGKGEG